MRFYLGTHMPSWLDLVEVPLFVSAVRLRTRSYARARGPWALDSGGFSVLKLQGKWTSDDRTYAGEVTRWAEEIGMPDFAAIRDWMCEPYILARTGKTIADHQAMTIESYTTLVAIAPEIPWLPVVQGWHPDDYRSHVEQYAAAGVDLRAAPRVGVGSVCRRQGTREGAAVIRTVADLGLKVHAFGAKVDGLKLFGDRIASADSMAWSYVARRRKIRMPGHAHKTCANCMTWALDWRAGIVSAEVPRQLTLQLAARPALDTAAAPGEAP